MRRCYMAAGHNTLRRSGPGQKQAVNLLHWLKWGVLIFGSTGSVHYPSVALSILDDYSRYIIAWKLCTTMKADDVSAQVLFFVIRSRP